MLNTIVNTNELHARHNFLSFGDAANLMQEGSRVNIRLRDMMSDISIIDADSAERAFRSIYRDVYDYLRSVMFTKTGEVIWTFAGQLERAGFAVYRVSNGLNLTVGKYTLNIPSPTEPNYMTTADIKYLSALIHAGE